MLRKKKRKLKERISINTLINLLKLFFFLQKYVTWIKTVNYPEGQFILSLWHCHQCVVFAVKDKQKFHVLISASNDGEIIAQGAASLGIQSVRGSSKRHGARAALSLIDKLENGDSVAIMVDGPKGPNRKVKDGIINIAKLSGVPIIPVSWQSKHKTFLKFNTWDEFRVPFGPCKSVALFGEPIYIPKDASKEEMQDWCLKLEDAMNNVEQDLKENYDFYLKQK